MRSLAPALAPVTASILDKRGVTLAICDRLLQDFELYGLIALYFPFEEIPHALAIAQRESGGHTGAWNYNPPVEDSRGLMQINVLAWPGPGAWNLWDPQVNLYWAWKIFSAEGWDPWRAAGLHPWPWA